MPPPDEPRDKPKPFFRSTNGRVYRPVFSTTVVFGLRVAVDILTKRPVIAERALPPPDFLLLEPLELLAIGTTSPLPRPLARDRRPFGCGSSTHTGSA